MQKKPFEVGDKVVHKQGSNSQDWLEFCYDREIDPDKVFTISAINYRDNKVIFFESRNIAGEKCESYVCGNVEEFKLCVPYVAQQPAKSEDFLDWSYQEALSLQQVAQAAIEKYNEYISKQPSIKFEKL